jgi:hypothetical protein
MACAVLLAWVLDGCSLSGGLKDSGAQEVLPTKMWTCSTSEGMHVNLAIYLALLQSSADLNYFGVNRYCGAVSMHNAHILFLLFQRRSFINVLYTTYLFAPGDRPGNQ